MGIIPINLHLPKTEKSSRITPKSSENNEKQHLQSINIKDKQANIKEIAFNTGTNILNIFNNKHAN